MSLENVVNRRKCLILNDRDFLIELAFCLTGEEIFSSDDLLDAARQLREIAEKL